MALRPDLREINRPLEPEYSSGWKHDLLFFGFLAAAAFLARQTVLEGERFFWLLISILASNALYLRFRQSRAGLTGLISIGTNSLLVAYLVESSGGPASILWPLFLLPIYTAGFSLPSWVMRTAGLNMALLSCQYLILETRETDRFLLELCVKISFLLISSCFIALLAQRERAASRRASVRGLKLLRAKKRMKQDHSALRAANSAVIDALQGLGDRMSIILGTAQLLQESSATPSPLRPDLERIVSAAIDSGEITRSLRVKTSRLTIEPKEPVGGPS